MRILLDAYFDNNFGDDLFIDTLLGRYPGMMFYTFWRGATDDVLRRALRFPNLVILPNDCDLLAALPYDAYIMIGGDVLPDGIDYARRIAGMKHTKKHGGLVAMLGFSLYANYGEKTADDLRQMAELSDIIVIRDAYSAAHFRAMAPQARVTQAADMAFARLMDEAWPKEEEKEDILGLIPRRRLYATDEEHDAYCRLQADIASRYLQTRPESRVRLLCFSTGEYDDRVTAGDIVGRMWPEELRERTEIVSHEGSIMDFADAVAGCRALVPTRFHGLVLALRARIPFVPVPYELKLTSLLDELSYEGPRIPYGKQGGDDFVDEVLNALCVFPIAEEKLAEYEMKGALFFPELDEKMKCLAALPDRTAASCQIPACEQGRINSELRRENQYLQAQVDELKKWITLLKQERVAFEQQNLELVEINASLKQEKAVFEQQNLELVKTNASLGLEKAALEQQCIELEKWIASLKQERAAFERQNLELESLRREQESLIHEQETQLQWFEQQMEELSGSNRLLEERCRWLLERVRRIPLVAKKIETEYRETFCQSGD